MPLSWISPNVVQAIFTDATFNLLAAGIGVGILTIPLVASVSEDAMRAVPIALREAVIRLGRPQAPDVRPRGVPGCDLGHRGSDDPGHLPGDRRDDGRRPRGRCDRRLRCSPSTHSARPDDDRRDGLTGRWERPGGRRDAAFQSLFFVGLLLFVMTLALNIIGDSFVRRVRQKY